MLLLFQTGMAGASNVEATDSETNASLLNPESGIPFDVHFDIEDNDGNNLGMLGEFGADFGLGASISGTCRKKLAVTG